ncbi:uncharacterized protein J3R85_008824 [Psidium guajava]|nr:uncharacterized protein J3R85_008824 [Psidium guajava]
MIFSRVRSANDIVQDTCKKIAANDRQLNFDCEVSWVRPESGKVDLEGLGLIGLKLLQANLTDITEYTKQLLKQKLEPRPLKSLSSCLSFYSKVEGKDMTPLYKS